MDKVYIFGTLIIVFCFHLYLVSEYEKETRYSDEDMHEVHLANDKIRIVFFYSSWAFDLYVVKVMMSSVITKRRTLAQQFRQYFPSAALHTLTDVTRTHYDVSSGIATGRILKYGISGDCVSRPEGQIEDLEEEFGTDVDYDVIDFAKDRQEADQKEDLVDKYYEKHNASPINQERPRAAQEKKKK